VEAGKEAKDDDFWPQAQRAKERGWPILQLTADHNAQWSAPEALGNAGGSSLKDFGYITHSVALNSTCRRGEENLWTL